MPCQLICAKKPDGDDPEGWKEFNKVLSNMFKKSPPENYDQYENGIKKAMNKAFKRITVKKGIYKHKMSMRVKELKEEKKNAVSIGFGKH